MHANQTDVQKILGGVQQYVVPLFQRQYSWKTRQWQKLWDDLVELCEEAKPRSHFIGSIVTMPERSVPEGVSKFVLIDGQQRLTTILILLAAARDKARRGGDAKLADKIDDLMLKNRHQDETDVYKVLPTQGDRASFCELIDGTILPAPGGIVDAYKFFEKQLRSASAPASDRLYTAVCKDLVLVSIVLDKDDNPHLIFESLNAAGEPLTQADLVRNFIFMRVQPRQQDRAYREFWEPMQRKLGGHLTDFMRHYLMRDGVVVKQGEIYFSFKDRVEGRGDDGVQGYLADLATFADYYARLIEPSREPDPGLRARLGRLNQFEATTAYPFLLNAYHDHATGVLKPGELAAILDVLESYLIRRYVCEIPTNSLTRIFVALYTQARAAGGLIEGTTAVLAGKRFPSDGEFRDKFVSTPLYLGERKEKTRLILNRLETAYKHKEAVALGALTIEHVMPQTLTEWWKSHLGGGWEADHAAWVHTVGNLTLTGYNSELSNYDFAKKKAIYAASHVELNRYFEAVESWNVEAIESRARTLSDAACVVWPDLKRDPAEVETAELTEDEPEDYSSILDGVLEELGGAVAQMGEGSRRIYKLADGRVVSLKYSRSHGKNYWFGLHKSLWDELRRVAATHVVLVLGREGYAVLPIDVVGRYIDEAGTSPNSDGSVRHYHVLVTAGAAPTLFHRGKPFRYPIADYMNCGSGG